MKLSEIFPKMVMQTLKGDSTVPDDYLQMICFYITESRTELESFIDLFVREIGRKQATLLTPLQKLKKSENIRQF